MSRAAGSNLILNCLGGLVGPGGDTRHWRLNGIRIPYSDYVVLHNGSLILENLKPHHSGLSF